MAYNDNVVMKTPKQLSRGRYDDEYDQDFDDEELGSQWNQYGDESDEELNGSVVNHYGSSLRQNGMNQYSTATRSFSPRGSYGSLVGSPRVLSQQGLSQTRQQGLSQTRQQGLSQTRQYGLGRQGLSQTRQYGQSAQRSYGGYGTRRGVVPPGVKELETLSSSRKNYRAY